MLQCNKMQDAIARKCFALCRQSGVALLLGVSILLSGCDSIPEAVNPFTWFGDDEQEAPPAPAAANTEYPKLGSVPKRPPSLESHMVDDLGSR